MVPVTCWLVYFIPSQGVAIDTMLLQTFVLAFQSRMPQPCVYIRCLLQSLIINDMRVLRNMSIKQLLFDDLEEVVLPADILLDLSNGDIEAPHDPRFQIVRKMEAFLVRTGPVNVLSRFTHAPVADSTTGLL